ncbi:SIGNAL PEPTIDE PEPTIDASE [Salix purpurea]|uniref:SIGNAL PEPTIDE PEPTIDASE n=1 Tax=Salix purpurea TaxID=77065 RepID=A0A9Q0ZV08_SALPP|nr:SIGNAL PEPTIDE PEPTIDASE [Salix purpurea]
METLWKLLYLLEPAPVTLIVTAVAVTFGSAFRALNYGKEMERNLDLSEASITLDRSQALMIPVMSSCSLLLMFYLFSSVSQLLTVFTAIASVSSLFFCLSPFVAYIKSCYGLADPFVSRCCAKSFTRIEGLLLLSCFLIVAAWLVSGHWILNNLLGISICIAFVSHRDFLVPMSWYLWRLSKHRNPVHTVANSLSLPGLQLITKKLELPVKIVFPRNLFSSSAPGGNTTDFMMLGLGDMAIPAMLLALVLCFDYRKSRDPVNLFDLHSSKGHKYIWYALPGYAIGLVFALAAGVLTHSPQPALLYLVPSTLGPVTAASWFRRELPELWEGSMSNVSDKARQIEV